MSPFFIKLLDIKGFCASPQNIILFSYMKMQFKSPPRPIFKILSSICLRLRYIIVYTVYVSYF